MANFQGTHTFGVTLDDWNFTALRYNAVYQAALRVLYEYGLSGSPSDFDTETLQQWAADVDYDFWDVRGLLPITKSHINYLLVKHSKVLDDETRDILETVLLALKYRHRIQDLRTFSASFDFQNPSIKLFQQVRGVHVISQSNEVPTTKAVADLIGTSQGWGSAEFSKYSESIYKILMKTFSIEDSLEDLDKPGYFLNDTTLGEEIESLYSWSTRWAVLDGPRGDDLTLLMDKHKLSWVDHVLKNLQSDYYSAVVKGLDLANQVSGIVTPAGIWDFPGKSYLHSLPSFSLEILSGAPFEFEEELEGWTGCFAPNPKGIFINKGIRYDFADCPDSCHKLVDFYYKNGTRARPNKYRKDTIRGTMYDGINNMIGKKSSDYVTVSDLVYEIPSNYSVTDFTQTVAQVAQDYKVVV